MKFEDIVNGKVKNPTGKEVQEALHETITSFTKLKDMNEFLQRLVAGDAYKVIKDIVKPQSNALITDAKQNDVEEYQKFQDIQRASKAIYEWENTPSTHRDTQRISTQIASDTVQKFYNICVRMISTLDDELNEVEKAVNRIEEKIGLDPTNFEKENHDDTAKLNDVQRSEESTE